jgi:DNA-binding XRE family transcriptional regulator
VLNWPVRAVFRPLWNYYNIAFTKVQDSALYKTTGYCTFSQPDSISKKQSQELTSGLAGIGRTHLSAIERGERKPTLDTFFKIADALNVRPSVLMAAIEDAISKK